MSRTAEGRQAGLTDEKISRVEDYERADFSEREKVALRYSERMIDDPPGIDDAFFAEVKKHFDDGEIAEIGYTVIAYSGAHRFLTSIDHTPLDDDGHPIERDGVSYPLEFNTLDRTMVERPRKT